MRTIRRLYFYAVATVSLEVVLWGLIVLLRTTFAAEVLYGARTLAQALALILVGVPIFGLHWWWIQNAAAKDEEEHTASLRALYLYLVLLITLIPVAQNVLALINRTLMQGSGLDTYRALLGGQQSWKDNLIAIVLNGVAAVYFYVVVQRDWQTLSNKENFADLRRLYRFIWVIYSLAMVVFGVQQLIRFIFAIPGGPAIIGLDVRQTFINGLALILVGAPIWVYVWKRCQEVLAERGEQQSSLRLGVLYLLALAGVAVTISSGGVLIDQVLRRVLGESIAWRDFLFNISMPISIGVPFAMVWAYYTGWFNHDVGQQESEQRRAALKRLYAYVLSLAGLVAAFVGLALIMSFIIDSAVGNVTWGGVLRNRLAGSISTLLAGLPVWLMLWRPMQAEALGAGEAAEHARRSIIRRAYLYFVIFAAVIGIMASAIWLVYLLINAALSRSTETGFLSNVLNALQLLILFSVLLAYHLNCMRRDGAHSADKLAKRQADFGVMVFINGEVELANAVAGAIRNKTPGLPVVVQPITEGIPAEAAETIKAVVLPGNLAVNPPEALRLWLKEYNGHKVIVPHESEGWVWSGMLKRSINQSAEQAAQVIHQLSEGQAVQASIPLTPWLTVAYIFAVLFGIQLLFFAVMLILSSLFRGF